MTAFFLPKAMALSVVLLALGACATPARPVIAGSRIDAPKAAAVASPVVVPPAARKTPAPAAKAPDLASLTVTIEGASPQTSQLLVGLYEAAEYPSSKPPKRHDEAAATKKAVVRFANVKPGRYAVKILQDINGNRVVDKTLIGVPEEPFGLSNDIKPKLSEPGFGETSFLLKPGPNAITIHMQQM